MREDVCMFMFEEIRQREGGWRTGVSDWMTIYVLTRKNREHVA